MPLHFYVWWILGLGLAGGLSGYVVAPVPLPDGVRDRVRPAQHHLRAPDPDVVPVLRPGAVGPAHLAGQLRHPLGADVPDLRADDPGAVQHRRGRLRLHAVDQRARWPSSPWPPCRSSTSSGVRMRKSMFPVSWLIQARLADVATIVDENVNGVRVVQVLRRREASSCARWPRRPTRCSGATSRTPTSGPGGRPAVQNLPQVGLALVLVFGGYMVIHGSLGRRHRGLQRLPPHAPGAVHDARDDHHDGPAGRGVGRAHLRDPRRAAHHRRPARRGRPRRLPGRRPLRRRRLRLRPRPARCPRRTSTSTCARARPSPWSAGPARASRPWPACSPRFYDVTEGTVRASTATTSGT